MDDAMAAEQLMDDLLALIDSGLVAIVDDEAGPARYRVVDPFAGTGATGSDAAPAEKFSRGCQEPAARLG